MDIPRARNPRGEYWLSSDWLDSTIVLPLVVLLDVVDSMVS